MRALFFSGMHQVLLNTLVIYIYLKVGNLKKKYFTKINNCVLYIRIFVLPCTWETQILFVMNKWMTPESYIQWSYCKRVE